MHVAFILEKIPVLVTGGTGMHVVLASMLQALLAHGHRVTACFVLERHAQRSDLMAPLAELEASGITTRIVTVEAPRPTRSVAIRGARLLRRAIAPSLTDFYRNVTVAEEVKAVLEPLRPDVIVGHPVTAMAAVYNVHIAPRLTIVGNLDHLVPLEKWRAVPKTRVVPFALATLRLLAARHLRDDMERILRETDTVAANTVHHAQWLREHGFPGCPYLPNPIADLAGPDWERQRVSSSSRKPRILMIGNLIGAATVPGLWLFVDEVLPRLEALLGVDGFEVHLVGRDDPPPGLARRLARPSVVLRGFVNDAGPEFLAADVLLVPTPIELGARMRIAVGACYGCCIVAHRANLVGAPEFVADRDLLAAGTGAELADAVVRALRDPKLRADLGRAARQTYEREFSLAAAGSRLVRALEDVRRRHATAGSSSETAIVAGSRT